MGLINDIVRGFAKSAATALGSWAADSDEDITPAEMSKALQSAGLAEPTAETPKALFLDPFQSNDWGGWRQRPSNITYETLRHMSMACSPIAAILQLRTLQVSHFARPQQGQFDRGYRVVLRDRRDRRKSMTPVESRRAAEIERMLETTGVLMPGEQPRDRDSFRTYLKKIVRDQLTYDQSCTEILRDRLGRPSRFIALPAETIRPALVDFEHMSIEDRKNVAAYVQIYENVPVAEFTQQEMIWSVMNPRTDLRAAGFGFSPIEQIVRLVTAWLFGFSYNQNFFSQGSTIKGLLNVKGTIPDRQMRAFRRQWYAMISGVENAWRTPILNSEDVQWVSMHSNNREMEFSAWMDWVTKLICAVYSVDPLEINFQFGNTGQSNSLNSGSQEEKLVESKDKGLRPTLEHLTDLVNQHLIWEIEPDFEILFSGLDKQSEDDEREGRIKEVTNYRTVDEVRALEELPPLPDGMGKAVLNPVWLQFYTAQTAQAAAAAGMLPPGAPGAPGEAPPDGLMGDDGKSADGDALLGKKPPAAAAASSGDDDDDSLLSSKPASGDDDEEDDSDELLSRAESLETYTAEKLQKAFRVVHTEGERQVIELHI